MPIQTKNKIINTLKKLDQAGVKYLDFDAYNEVDRSLKYRSEYEDLFEEVVVGLIFKHFKIAPQNNESIFNFFGKENGAWYVAFYEPEIYADLGKILHGDYSELEALREY